MTSFISSFETFNVVVYDPSILLWIAASVAYVAAVNPNGIKTLLANCLSRFFIKGKPVFSNSPNDLPEKSPDCPILCNWVFGNLISTDELFPKAYEVSKLVLVNNNLCVKLFSSLE